MSTLGKIVTVFIVVASVGLASMVVAFVPRTNDWHAVAMEQQKALKEAAQARAALEQAVLMRNRQLASTQKSYRGQVDAAASAMATLNDRKAQLEGQVSALETSKSALETQIAGLNESFKNTQADATQWKDKYDQAIATTKNANDDAQALAKDKYDLRRTVADLERKVRLYEERIVEQEKKIAWLTHAFPGKLPEYQETPTTDLVGLIKEADNKQLVAEISLGSSDGVAKGLTFIVSRDNKYLADLEITKVDENTAVGRLKTVQGEVQEGDNVTFDYRK